MSVSQVAVQKWANIKVKLWKTETASKYHELTEVWSDEDNAIPQEVEIMTTQNKNLETRHKRKAIFMLLSLN